MSRFIGDADDFVERDEDLPLVTTKRLLEVLDVADEPYDVQKQAVHDWLAENTPDPVLRLSLVRAGFLQEKRA